jgi:hypothetical protein
MRTTQDQEHRLLDHCEEEPLIRSAETLTALPLTGLGHGSLHRAERSFILHDPSSNDPSTRGHVPSRVLSDRLAGLPGTLREMSMLGKLTISWQIYLACIIA